MIKLLGKWKTCLREKINDEIIRLKSEMHSMKNIDGKESNTRKGINIATEFNKFKDIIQ